MMHDFTLDDEQLEIVRNMFRLIDAMPTCADDLLDCDMDMYCEVSDIFLGE